MSNSTNETIRIIRNLRGFKQSYMALKMGVSQQDYSHLEKHGKKITLEQMIIICKILEVNKKFVTQFDSTLFFEQMQQEKLDTVIPDNLLRSIDDKSDKLATTLKAQIKKQQENLNGLRKQNRKLNETIKDLMQLLLEKKVSEEIKFK